MRLALAVLAFLVGPLVHPSLADEAAMNLDLEGARRLASLPLACIQRPLPYKADHVLGSPEELAMPQEHHPAFYGCFDWHSAVHAHWSLVALLKRFPTLDENGAIRAVLDAHLSAENLATEAAYFSMNDETPRFERTYGWAWLLALARELHEWDDDDARRWSANLQPLADRIVELYLGYLPRLVYPIRVGEHTNTAFGLAFALDYAREVGRTDLAALIEARARDFYGHDVDAPLRWEPSGHDFLSPVLQELDLMRRVLSPEDFAQWAPRFLPGIEETGLVLEPGLVIDRSDGKLVHLDGLNFSRAWCLYPLVARYPALRAIADTHLAHSLPHLFDGAYAGQHWLASFALVALRARDEAVAGE